MPAAPVSIYYVNENGSTKVWGSALYGGNGWVNSAYRTITLNEPATGDLLTWLQTNATKQ